MLRSHVADTDGWGEVREELTESDLLLAVSMVATAVTHVAEDERVAVASRAWELLGIEVRIPPAEVGAA